MNLVTILFGLGFIILSIIFVSNWYINNYVYKYFKLRPDDIESIDNYLIIDKLGKHTKFSHKKIKKIKIVEDKDGFWTISVILHIF